jgi:hypothetical protein
LVARRTRWCRSISEPWCPDSSPSGQGQAFDRPDHDVGFNAQNARLRHIVEPLEQAEQAGRNRALDLLVAIILIEYRTAPLDRISGQLGLETGLIGGNGFLLGRKQLRLQRRGDDREAARLVAARHVGIEQRLGRDLEVDAGLPGDVVLLEVVVEHGAREVVRVERVAVAEGERHILAAEQVAEQLEQLGHVLVCARIEIAHRVLVGRIGVADCALERDLIRHVIFSVGED